jgi:hypothetical protein
MIFLVFSWPVVKKKGHYKQWIGQRCCYKQCLRVFHVPMISYTQSDVISKKIIDVSLVIVRMYCFMMMQYVNREYLVFINNAIRHIIDNFCFLNTVKHVRTCIYTSLTNKSDEALIWLSF